jgi:transcriptional antiterminator RfaH
VIVPLFPRYLFVQLDPDVKNTAPIRSTQGVVDLVRFGNLLVPLPEGFVEELAAKCDPDSGVQVTAESVFAPGRIVKVVDGLFVGWRGVCLEGNSQERVMVLMQVLGQSQRLLLSRNQVVIVDG